VEQADAAQRIEQQFFRALNAVVEPAVRFGVGSPRCAPAGLVLLESRGFRSGLPRRTPLLAVRVQGHLVVSTFRGERSFWVKNLAKTPQARYWLAGRPRRARAFVIDGARKRRIPASLPPLVARIAHVLQGYARAGWAFAILAPLE
jgi:deazaflavin-dependent oxidoreductase (nitroreductase family)